jgi:serine/threonine protein kinase
MNRQHCPNDSLSMLVRDELPPEESENVLAHLEECSTCQCELETLTADVTWWERTSRNLSKVEIDSLGQLPKPDSTSSSVEVLLEVERPEMSTQALTTMLDPPTHPEMLGRIDEFDIEEQIGQGGMGVVFRGFDRSLNRPVAIKVMAPHLGANGVARKRFAREAQAAAAVVHPHVVPIYRVSSSPERPYIAMALIDGLSLQEKVSLNGPIESLDVVRISIQIADGLAAAHRQGLIHRDMKPANILMEKDVSRVVITDFGLARAVDDVAMTQSGCMAGTPNYMSPEQVTDQDIDHRSDLFGLGGVMYFMATGREPFRSESAFAVINKVIRETPRSARSVNAEIPETLDRIIARLLEKNPADRIQSADELQQLLTEYLAHLQDPRRHAEPQVKATRSERRKVFKQVALGLVVILILLAYMLSEYLPNPQADTNPMGGPEAHHEHEETEHHEHSDSHE